jgi:hypothetical protein
MCIELLVLVYVTFKRHSGIYFWSIIVTTFGLILQTTGYILKEFENSCPPVLVTIICKLGWVSNVSGFSIVLWSRLHLVVNDSRVLRGVLIMIIINGIACHTPIVVFEFGLMSKYRSTFYHPMEIMVRSLHIPLSLFIVNDITGTDSTNCFYAPRNDNFVPLHLPHSTFPQRWLCTAYTQSYRSPTLRPTNRRGLGCHADRLRLHK